LRSGILTLRPLLLVTLLLVSTCAIQAQVTNVTSDQQTPTQGVGHDYIRLLSETVDPSTGALSIRITVPTPNGRGLTIPFAFAYDSNGVNVPASGVSGTVVWQLQPANLTNTGALSQGGWSYALPMLNYGNEATDDRSGETCLWTHDYVFQDSAGGRHALQLATADDLATYDCVNSDLKSSSASCT
jgi:hypothetical protein